MLAYIDSGGSSSQGWVPIVLIVAGVGIAAAVIAGLWLSMSRRKRTDDPLR